MGYNGSGVFSRARDCSTDEGNSIPIRSDYLDQDFDEIATGLSNCICKDGQSSPSQNLPMNSKKHTGVADASERNEYLTAGQLQDGEVVYLGTVAGINTLTATATPTLTAYVTGMMVAFKVANDNTGTVTLNIDSVGAKSIKKSYTEDLIAGDIVQNQIIHLIYDGTNFQLLTPNLRPYGCNLRLVSAQSIPDSTITAILYGSGSESLTETFDYGDIHSESANTSRITVPHDGIYVIQFYGVFAANATGSRELSISLNGTQYVAQRDNSPSSSDFSVGSIGAIWPLDANDYVESHAYQSSGGALNLTVARFGAVRVRM